MSIDMFVNPDEDPRSATPVGGDERGMLVGFLRWQRETLALKCAGLDPAQLATRAVEPSRMSLLGLVRHMVEVEQYWFQRVMSGQEVVKPYSSKEDPDGDWDGAVGDPAVVAQAWAAWEAQVAFSDQVVAGAADLDVTGDDPWDGPVSLRYVLIHMIEEYARHNGHADLLRERIDGAVGQ